MTPHLEKNAQCVIQTGGVDRRLWRACRASGGRGGVAEGRGKAAGGAESGRLMVCRLPEAPPALRSLARPAAWISVCGGLAGHQAGVVEWPRGAGKLLEAQRPGV